ncbi:MAG: NAD(P)H-quinone oxidoreductase subunit F [Cyanobacteriota bacterium]|nr:NAD(P)H-quinone oxidoreductase subunit F [Cyanobacteriota bacterium]
MADFLLQHSWLIPLYSLAGAVLTLPWSFRLIRATGPRPAAYFNILMTLISALHGLAALTAVWGQPARQLVWDWLTVADLNLSLSVQISPVTIGALEVVTGVSFLAQLYALGYMEKDWSLARFYGLLGFFEAALGGIALSDSLLFSYALLEMLTLSTYLLVGFWYAQPLVVSAARDAFLTKRVGDIILLMGLVALSSYGEGLTFSQLETWAASSPIPPLTAALLGLSLIAGPTGKCAQFPLNLWLDEAMEGPNPAGIMRNSIVVSAGAYVLIKLQPVFTLSPLAAGTLITLGAFTAVTSSCIALAQIDIKRTLSHSTSVYLGLVFIAVGLGDVDIAFLLLFSHALAKALLFMSAGAVITTTSNQNIMEMGGLGSRMPATTTAFLVGGLGLIALLPSGMFFTWSRWFNGDWGVNGWLLALLAVVNLLSALNLTRVFRLVFLGVAQAKTRRAPEVAWPMAVPMVSLILLTLCAPLAPLTWPLWLSPNPPLHRELGGILSQAPALLMLTGVVGMGIGFLLPLGRAWSRPTLLPLRFFQDLFAYDLYLDRIYSVTIVAAVSAVAKMSAWFDRYVIDGAVNLVSLATLFSGSALKYNVSGQSQFYLLTMLVALSLLFWFTLSGQWEAISQFWGGWLSGAS